MNITCLLLALLPCQVDPDKLQRGLIATHTDTAGTTITRLEPNPALNLGKGESLHPRLASHETTTTWQGYLNITRADEYRFRARLVGDVTVSINEKPVLQATHRGAAPTLHESKPIRLEAGVLPLQIRFKQPDATARLEILWSSKHFREEPLPFDVLGHLPDKTPASLAQDHTAEQGRFLVEEHACVKCHTAGANRMAKGLIPRQGPDLTRVGTRVHGEWIYRWLDDPKKMRPGSLMPQLFPANADGAAERYAVMRYLVSLGGPVVDKAPQLNPQQLAECIARGKPLFTSLGCVTCHGPVGEEKPAPKKDEDPATFVFLSAPRPYPFKGMGGKTSIEHLTSFLRNPHANHPTSRMPNFLLEANEARDLACFLANASGVKDHQPPKPPPAPQLQKALAAYIADAKTRERIQLGPEDAQWSELGKRIVHVKKCSACHQLPKDVVPVPDDLREALSPTKLDNLTIEDRGKKGCLAAAETARGKAPNFGLRDADRSAILTFLVTGLKGANTPSPTYQARTDLARFNCLACHSRDGDGGLSPRLIEELRKYERAENAEAVVPPPLTGVGHKLRNPWLRQVLLQQGRARPWMGLRMPQFGDANVGRLPEALALLDGAEPSNEIHKVALNGEKVSAGRLLAGKSGFGCISCHDIAGIPNRGTRGPDLATMNERVRFDWYQRWMENAQRIQPGTRMPTVFPDGKSQLTQVLKGHADAQSEAMWAYFSLGNSLQLPEGIEPAIKGLVLHVQDDTRIFRTFLPEAGTRAIAVGYPEGVSVAFDSTTCRLAYAWSGPFLDVGPVWNDRGGNPAKVLGPRFWTAPQGTPWGLTGNGEPPDFATRRKDPAFGAPLPEGKLPDGPMKLRFEGYDAFPKGSPVFRYRIGLKEEETLAVAEMAAPLRAGVGVGVERKFRLTVPAKQSAWMLVAESAQRPVAMNAKGEKEDIPAKDEVEVATTARALLVPQAGGRPLLIRTTTVPEGAKWLLQKRGTTWQTILRLPDKAEAMQVRADIALWVPHRDEPDLIKELLAAP